MGFGVMSRVGNAFIGFGRKIGRSFGYEMAVVSSSHSLDARMEAPNTDGRAWDSEMYRRGNLFIDGYSNPVKPVVIYDKDLEEPNRADLLVTEEGEDGEEQLHTDIISSPRYREYMRQDLISQLLNPREQWKLLAYGLIGVAALQFFSIIVTLYATGSF